MSDITLSYVITTYNKLDYLRAVLENVARNRKPDEEIIVVDGASKDGTAEYLAQLFAAGKIQKFVSERDFGEGHGFNKGMLMAEGKLIKLLTDDDAYDFTAIGHCRKYMLEHPQVDFLNTHGGWYDIQLHNEIFIFTEVYLQMLEEWKEKGTPFAFCMLGTMINRKSLPFLGLLNPSIKRADAEYSLRITSQKIKIAWYLGPSYARILNQQSNSARYEEIIKRETEKLNSFYDVSIDGESEKKNVSFIDTIKGKLKKSYHSLQANGKTPADQSTAENTPAPKSPAEALAYATKWLEEQNKGIAYTFFSNIEDQAIV